MKVSLPPAVALEQRGRYWYVIKPVQNQAQPASVTPHGDAMLYVEGAAHQMPKPIETGYVVMWTKDGIPSVVHANTVRTRENTGWLVDDPNPEWDPRSFKCPLDPESAHRDEYKQMGFDTCTKVLRTPADRDQHIRVRHKRFQAYWTQNEQRIRDERLFEQQTAMTQAMTKIAESMEGNGDAPKRGPGRPKKEA